MDRVEALFQQYRIGKSQYIRSLKGIQEEDEILDFKRLKDDKTPLKDGDKKNISETISAFANNCGGLLILGVDARSISVGGPDVVQEYYPICGLKSLHTLLLSIIPQITQGGQINIAYEPVEEPEGSDTGFMVIHIPATDGEPVRATATGVSQYFVRNGATTQIMSHAQLSDMFGRRPQPKLEIIWRIIQRSDVFDIAFGLRNIGRGIAKYPALRFRLTDPEEAGKLAGMHLHGGGPYIRETTEFPNAIVYKGQANQFIHISTTEWIARYMTKCTIQTLITRNFEFEIDFFCEGLYRSETISITKDKFIEERNKAQRDQR